MPIGLAVPVNVSTFEIENISQNFNANLSMILGCRCDVSLELLSNCTEKKYLVCPKGIRFSFPGFKCYFDLMWQEESDWEYQGKHYNTEFYFADVSGCRKPVGYLFLAALMTALAKEALDLVEDPANAWLGFEFSKTGEFLERIKGNFAKSSSHQGILVASEAFYEHLERKTNMASVTER